MPPSSNRSRSAAVKERCRTMLTEIHGAWLYEPTDYSYQWRRCDGAGNNCVAIPGATSQTDALTPSDVGSTIRVQETASNTTGESEPATSAPTAPVASSSGGEGGTTGGGAGRSVLAAQSVSPPAP